MHVMSLRLSKETYVLLSAAADAHPRVSSKSELARLLIEAGLGTEGEDDREELLTVSAEIQRSLQELRTGVRTCELVLRAFMEKKPGVFEALQAQARREVQASHAGSGSDDSQKPLSRETSAWRRIGVQGSGPKKRDEDCSRRSETVEQAGEDIDRRGPRRPRAGTDLKKLSKEALMRRIREES